jgi:hypothetical protein
VKLEQFYALCVREWGKAKRGDVVSLSLTEAGHEELSRDVIMTGVHWGHEVLLEKEDLPRISAGGPVGAVVNPVTRSVVKIRTKKTGSRETARVRVAGGTCRQTWWAAEGATA